MNGFMKDFIITTDTTTDLPASYVNEHHLGMMSLPYTIENQTYTWEHSLPEKEFYAMMRNGSLPTTSFLSIPRPLVIFPCGSISIANTFFPNDAKHEDKLIAVVVLPTPPF